MSNLGPVIVWAAGRQWLDEQTFLWRLFRRSVQLLLLSIIISCNMQSLHCLKSQLASKVQYKTGNLAVIAYFDTREMFARVNAARKQMALWLTGKSCEWPDRCVQKRQKDSSALSANESPIEWIFFFSFVKSKPDSVHGTGGRLRARCPRGLGGEAALVTVGCFFFFSLSRCWRRRRGCWTCSSVRAAAWRLQGGTIEQEAGAWLLHCADCTVQWRADLIFSSSPWSVSFSSSSFFLFFFFLFFFTLFCPGTTQKDSLPPRLAESRDVI